MTTIEEVKETFKNVVIGTVFTTSEVKYMVNEKFGRNPGSVIPTDYCYNRYNNGIDLKKHLKIFEYTTEKNFKYLGTDYPYTGKIYHKPKSGYEICIGELVNGNLKNSYIEEKRVVERSSKESLVRRTRREVGLTLRYQILKRDNFKCCMCGASPAKDPSVELHIDHIKPWSKGGETTIENLQTLCSKCNLGKSDLE